MPRARALSKQEKKWYARPSFYEYNTPPADESEIWFRHANWEENRAKVRATLASTGHSDNAMYRFDHCGADAVVEWSETEKRHRVRANYCHNRHCKACSKSRSTLLVKNLQSKLGEATPAPHQFKFVTLTLRHTDTPLADQIKRLYKSFARLRASKIWKGSQKGGAAILEVKWKEETLKWHPHLHIIAEGGFMNRERLSAEWHRITKDSLHVHIQTIKTTRDVAYYVGKYVTKGCNDEVWNNLSAAQEWVTASKGVRFCTTYGTWRGFKLMRPDRSNDAKDWVVVTTIKKLAERVRNHEDAAFHLLVALADALQYDPHRKRRSREKST